jgi:hypothetical protein
VRIRPSNSGHERENGVIITLIAIFMLFVVGAMAALSIDVVTFYTARSEAQIAADSAALAAARVLANSGLTSSGGTASDPNSFPIAATETLAQTIATQVAQQNLIGGSTPQVTVTFPNLTDVSAVNNPQVTVKVTRTDLPTFFARIWGTMTVAVSATATAEAYNPSGLAANGSNGGQAVPVASSCVKPWLLPNIDPNSPTNSYIFDPGSGAIQDPGLLGWDPGPPTPVNGLSVACPGGDCSGALPVPSAWKYFPGDLGTFVPPSPNSVGCFGSGRFTSQYQLSVAGCVQSPIACNATIAIDPSNYGSRDYDTALAVDCLTHALPSDGGDKVDTTNSPPYAFLPGASNPLFPNPPPQGTDILTSDSLVTVPVFNSSVTPPTSPVQIIGFVQLFLQPTGSRVGYQNLVRTTVINMVGCGTNASGTPVYGNGPSAVPVRLIANPPAN